MLLDELDVHDLINAYQSLSQYRIFYWFSDQLMHKHKMAQVSQQLQSIDKLVVMTEYDQHIRNNNQSNETKYMIL